MKFHILLPLLFIANLFFAQESTNLLVFTKTNGYRHGSIDAGVPALWKMSKDKNWTVTFTEDSTYFNDANLKDVNVVVFLNTTMDVLGSPGEKAFEKYINNGGGYVGIHAAADTEYEWPFYERMLGAQFASHPKTQEATMKVHKDDPHLAIAHLDDTWTKVDEWYNFKKAVPSYANVLLELDESSYEGKRMGIKHPIAWYHEFEGGRVFYTGLGHTPETFSNETYLTHLEEGIKWAAGLTHVK
jgi:type 1 glutamine amidotransferase